LDLRTYGCSRHDLLAFPECNEDAGPEFVDR
jgi:hypothetical protein